MRKITLFAALMSLAALLALPPAASALGNAEIKTEAVAVNFHNEVTQGGYQVVSTTQLKKWIDAKKPMLIVDTMPYEASYKKNHIPGAKCFLFPIKPLKTMDAKTKAAFLKLLGPDKSRTLVFYCGFTKCTRSHNGALWAVKLGYKNVYRCPGGIVGWMQHGFKVGSVK